MNVYAVFRKIQSDSRNRRSHGYALVADEGHSIIINIGHARLKKTHLVGERVEVRRHKHIFVDVDHGLGIPIGEGVLPDTGVSHRHSRAR